MARQLEQMRKSRNEIMFALLVAAVLLTGVFLRFHCLTTDGLWGDELFTVAAATQAGPHVSWLSFVPKTSPELTVNDSFLTWAAADQTPPLFTLLLVGWSKLFGISDFALRSLGAIIGSFAPVVFYFGLRRPLGKLSALLGAALLAVSPSAVAYSQDVRAYSLTILLSAAASVRLIQRIFPAQDSTKDHEKGLGSFWIDILIYILLAYTHYTGLFLAGALSLLYFIFVIVPQKQYADILKLALVPLSMLPWIHLNWLTFSITNQGGMGWRDYSRSEIWTYMLPTALNYFLIDAGGRLLILWAATAIAAVVVIRQNGRWVGPLKNLWTQATDRKNLLALGFAAIVCLQFGYGAYNAFHIRMFHPRYFAASLPVMLASFALLFSAAKPGKILPVLLCGVIIVLSSIGLGKYYNGSIREFQEFREASQFVSGLACTASTSSAAQRQLFLPVVARFIAPSILSSMTSP
jgi:uncharacterized membrane protein